MEILVMEKTKDTERGYFRAYTLITENGTFSPKFLAMVGMY
jgi:hypothetical protein